MFTLMTVTLPGRPVLRMLAPDSEALRQAVEAGELVMLDPPVREPGRARAHPSSRTGPRANR